MENLLFYEVKNNVEKHCYAPELFYFEESFASSLHCVCSLTVCADTRLTEAAGPHLQTDGV